MNKKTTKWTLTGAVAATALFATGAVVNAETYTVKEGDTLSAIANEKDTTLEKLVEINKIADPNIIRVGQILELGNGAQATQTAVESATTAATPSTNYAAPAADPSAAASSGVVLSNGNTAGATGSYAASRMAELTGVPASTWEAIIARESNGQVDAYNASGASGLFQTMPGWGSTATVDDQIQSAYSAYNAQGLSAWGY
ncbi:LysM peptidoglycan-binding domain-containing protein [Streptococcus panodentis]|uniref:Peptidoglycan-binding protein n=1 Tax=Streptococcus panodentis TaxID=1581472 RepID=A0ABS5AUJ6_9STRE|nr:MULTISPECIES: LysM peptidoglycan-binding domain-containing protein [Streptococcus]KXT84922.1 Immunodominant antigen A [Streptococcus sp. DD11]MBP2620251.1 peptidoglycan-binding protein [Streptococcus panodentis]